VGAGASASSTPGRSCGSSFGGRVLSVARQSVKADGRMSPEFQCIPITRPFAGQVHCPIRRAPYSSFGRS
jgi:hypothetical protein